MVSFLDIFNPASYGFNPFFIPPSIVAILFLALGIFSLRLEKKASFTRPLLYLCLSVIVWLLSSSFVFNSKSSGIAMFWISILYSGFIFMPAALFHFAVVYTKRYEKEKSLAKTAYFLSGIFVVIFFIWRINFSGQMEEYTWGFYPSSGFLPLSLVGAMVFFWALAMVFLIKYYRQLPIEDLQRKRTKYIIIAFLFTFLSFIDVLPSYGVMVYPAGYLGMLCFVLSFTYGVVRHHDLLIRHHAKDLEIRVEEKTREISRIVQELRTTQVKLIETGKISALASLSAGIIHQISQPITAIHGFVKFMKKEMKTDDPFYKAIVIMEEQSTYLKEMLEDLMDLIRHREIKKENIDVHLCIKRATTLLTDELRIRRINWDVVSGEGLPMVYADSVHLQQIFMNIMVNAMEALSALPKGSRRYIKITSQFDSAEKDVVILFEDTGPGITSEMQQQIFEPFFSTKTKGAGIGLALCKDLIAEHGGKIGIESQEGRGTTFIVRLPAVTEEVLKNSQMHNLG